MRKVLTPWILGSTLLVSTALPIAANAHEANDIFVRVGIAQVSPDASSGSILGGGVDVEDSTGLGFSGTWFINKHIGVELLLALPFEHDIVGTGALDGIDIGSTKHLPPTISLQYYPLSEGNFTPYVGIGLNYTTFFSSKTTSTLDTALAGDTKLSLDDSTGVAFQVGFDWKLTNTWHLNAAIWKIDIETTADISVDGNHAASVDVNIDPYVGMVGVGFAF